MEFTLFYRGDLPSRGNPREKHLIRECFHSQLKDLWTRPPLNACTRLLDPPSEVGELSLIRHFHGYDFAPLVAEHVGLFAELDILLLWPAAPGSIITMGGDIDNRLKTLLDALKVPSEPDELRGITQSAVQGPFFCLLGDDKLVTRLSVETDRLLEPVQRRSEVVLTIRVRTRQLRGDLRTHPLTVALA